MGFQLYKQTPVPPAPSGPEDNTFRTWTEGVTAELNSLQQTVYDVRDFGAKGDGDTDDTEAIREALDAAISDSNTAGTVFFPVGTFKITSTITVDSVAGLGIRGSSMWSTVFDWKGNTTDPMLVLSDVRDSIIERFYVKASAANYLDTAIQIENGTNSDVAPTNNQFRDIWMEGTDTGIGKGFRMAQGAGGDVNNDFHSFYNCQVSNYSGAAWSIEHSQSKTHRMYSCGFQTNNNGGDSGVSVTAGSFYWFGGGGGGNEVADFDLDGETDKIIIEGGNFEGSEMLLQTPNSGAGQPCSIIGTRWNAGTSSYGTMIDHRNAGPLILTGNLFESNSGKTLITISYQPGAGGTFVCEGNRFTTSQDTSSTSASPFVFNTAANQIHIKGNNYEDEAGQNAPTQTFVDGDETPSVFMRNDFYTANTSATSIYNFDDGWDGHEITVKVQDSLTSFRHGYTSTPRLGMKAAADLVAVQGAAYKFHKSGNTWYEV